MSDGRKNKTYRDAAKNRMKAYWENMSPEQRDAKVAAMKAGRQAQLALASESVTASQLALASEPRTVAQLTLASTDDVTTALELLAQATSVGLGVSLTPQQAAEFWANRLRA